tara:strand:+ start:44577 stop:44939 length:363 start_codon:yes stop_codon:yes gene_type:complete
MNTQAASGLAIAGFVVLILSVFIPFYGLHIGGLALGLVAIGAFAGERLFTILTVTVSAVKVWFLSPTFQLMSRGEEGGAFIAIAIAAHAIPLIAIFIASRREPAEDDNSSNNSTGMPRGK